MAFAPASTPKKLGLFSAPKPNYRDFSGPPDGDYVRYVEGLLLWAEQEQARQRLKALEDKARSLNGSEWGRTSAKPSVLTTPMAQPGSVDSSMDRWKRKASAHAAKLQQQAQTAAGKPTGSTSKPQIKASGISVLAMFAGFVLAGIFAPSLLPVVIIAWVVFNVIRAVRAASQAGKP